MLGRYKVQTNEDILVSWIGGEPFLRSDIMNFSKRLHRLGIKVSVTTNGIPVSDKTLIEIDRCFSEIVFSIDSFGPCDNDVR